MYHVIDPKSDSEGPWPSCGTTYVQFENYILFKSRQKYSRLL